MPHPKQSIPQSDGNPSGSAPANVAPTLVLDNASHSGDPNNVLVSRSGDTLVIDATKTVGQLAGAYLSWPLRDGLKTLIARPASFQALLDVSGGLPPANSDIAVTIFVGDDPDPAACTAIAYAALRWDAAQNDPDYAAQGGAFVGAADAERICVSCSVTNYKAPVALALLRQTAVTSLKADNTGIGTATGNSNSTSTAGSWYIGIVVSPLSGSGGATDSVTVSGEYIASEGFIL